MLVRSIHLKPIKPLSLPKLFRNRKALRVALIAAWAGATVLAGIGVGLFITSNIRPLQAGEPPLPVATATVGIASVSTQDIVAGHANTDAALPIRSSSSVYQAAAEDYSANASLINYQTAAQLDALQPGFTSFVIAQGTTGTDPAH
jgi:hypothetical protein